jgi:hypothetical protein
MRVRIARALDTKYLTSKSWLRPSVDKNAALRSRVSSRIPAHPLRRRCIRARAASTPRENDEGDGRDEDQCQRSRITREQSAKRVGEAEHSVGCSKEQRDAQ